jgi:hypothetical protein
MRHTIIIEDTIALKDGVPQYVDVSGAPAGVHALQFNSETNKGWIEYVPDEDGNKPSNEPITSLPAWAETVFAHYETVANLNKQPLAGDPELGN